MRYPGSVCVIARIIQSSRTSVLHSTCPPAPMSRLGEVARLGEANWLAANKKSSQIAFRYRGPPPVDQGSTSDCSPNKYPSAALTRAGVPVYIAREPRGPFKGPRGPFKGPRGPLKFRSHVGSSCRLLPLVAGPTGPTCRRELHGADLLRRRPELSRRKPELLLLRRKPEQYLAA